MSYGDDYVFSYIWDGSDGWNIHSPLPADAQRIGGWWDIIRSVYSYYCCWGGRIMPQLIAQFFLWQGKAWFDLANTLVFLLLLFEIYWISAQGKIHFKLSAGFFLGIFLAVWTFILGFCGVFFWLDGACNYLWMNVILLSFILVYIRAYYGEAKFTVNKENPGKFIYMFFWGIAAGWTTENLVCWWILLLAGYIFWQKKQGENTANWQLSGFFGLFFGYLLLMAAPGNYVRWTYEVQLQEMDKLSPWLYDAMVFVLVMATEAILWLYIFHGVRRYYRNACSLQAKKTICLCLVFSAISMLSLLSMAFSPTFPLRAAFPSMLYLVIAAAILCCMRRHEVIQEAAKEYFVFRLLAGIYFLGTFFCTCYGFCLLQEQRAEIDDEACAFRWSAGTDKCLQVRPVQIPNWVYAGSVWHMNYTNLSEDPEDWKNVAYARYQGIKAVRVVTEPVSSGYEQDQ